jgi:hypothetical protein
LDIVHHIQHVYMVKLHLDAKPPNNVSLSCS